MIPLIPLQITRQKPEIAALHADTLGAKLKRRRHERRLRQIDAAKEMGVTESSIVGWERGSKTPEIRLYPAIIAFLGYEPWSKPNSLGERLLAERRRWAGHVNKPQNRLTSMKRHSAVGKQISKSRSENGSTEPIIPY